MSPELHNKITSFMRRMLDKYAHRLKDDGRRIMDLMDWQERDEMRDLHDQLPKFYNRNY